MTQIRPTSSTAVLVALTIILTQGCGSSPTEPPPGALFQTTQTVYQIPEAPARSIGVSFLVSNPLDETIYIREYGTSFIHLEKRVGSSWVVTHQVGFLSIPYPEIGLEPGQSLVVAININVNQPNTSPSLGPDAAGVYRAVFMVLRHPGRSSFLARSNEFELRASE